MSPEEVWQSISTLSQVLRLFHPVALIIAAQEPLLLQQHPAVTNAALQQLSKLVPDRALRHNLLLKAPEQLLQGQLLEQRMPAAAALLSLSCTQLAVALIQQPRVWWLLVPRHTWPLSPAAAQQQHQQQLSPAVATAVESMRALLSCGLRPPAVMQQVAVLQPLLLKLGAAAIHQAVQQLQESCEGCRQWQQQLQGLSPERLGQALQKISVWQLRMKVRFMG